MKYIKFILMLLNFTIATSIFATVEDAETLGKNIGTKVGSTVADFTIDRLDGSKFTLADYKGKKAVNLIFWATWCTNCKAEIPSLKLLYKNHGDDIEMLAINVNVNDSMKRVNRYLEKYEVSYPVAFDNSHGVSESFGVMGTPLILLIDINGIIRYRGSETPEDLNEHLDALLGR